MEKDEYLAELEEIESINGIPGGIIRNGLSVFFLSIVMLLFLSYFIQVDRKIPINLKFAPDQKIEILAKRLGDVKDGNIDTVLYMTVLKRDFNNLADTLFIAPKRMKIDVFLTFSDPKNDKLLSKNGPLKISYKFDGFLLISSVSNVLQGPESKNIYQLNVKSIPVEKLFKIMISGNHSTRAYLLGYKTTVFNELFSNLFHKFQLGAN